MILEAVMCGALCVPPRKEGSESELLSRDRFFCVATEGENAFTVASSASLGDVVKADIEGLPLVRRVEIHQSGERYDVRVVMDRLEFSSFERVVQKELALYDNFPALNFSFDIVPLDAVS